MEQDDWPEIALDTVLFINPDAWLRKKKMVSHEWVQTYLNSWSNIKKVVNLSSSIYRLKNSS